MHLKLKGSPLIALVGFMGCGKSTAGRLLAERLGWQFVDLDEEIERRTGRAVPEIFEQEGEAQFRQLEHEAFVEQQRLARQGRARVVAMGGGAFVESRNRDQLEVTGLSIWLDCPLDELWLRVAKESHRPLARRREDFDRLYQQRLPHYRLADFTVAASDAPPRVVEAILKLPLF
ncbi:MAG TPA: shikimate kinase [Bryobacterales bacterium]|nr:shikimate kinase [Bryobacterales bacterium]